MYLKTEQLIFLQYIFEKFSLLFDFKNVHDIWTYSNCSGTSAYNHFTYKQTLNCLAT